MDPENARLVGRVLRRVGGGTALLGTIGLVLLRLFAGRLAAGDPLAAFGRGILVASAAMLLTFVAALGLAVLIAGLALRLDEPRQARVAARDARALADEE